MDNRIEIKVETDDEVEPCDGTYACLFCSDSVRGKPALKCWQWNSNPFHRACDKHSRYAEVGRTCGRRTVEVWKGASAGTAAPSAIIDLTGAGDGAAEVARLTERGAREDAVPAVSGAVAAPDGVGQGARGGRADAESGGSGKGKEPAQAEAGPDAEAGGAATRGRAEGELVLSAAAARSRGTWTMAQQRLASAGRAAAEGVGEASLVAAVAHTAAGQRISRVEWVAGSGRLQTETREEAAKRRSKQEEGSRGNVSTIGKGADARSAEGRSSCAARPVTS